MSKFISTRAVGVYYKTTKAGRTYYIDYYGGDGRRQRRAVEGDFEAAKAQLGELQGKKAHGDQPALRAAVTYGDYAEGVLVARHERKLMGDEALGLYQQRLRAHVLPLLGRKRLDKVTKHDILRVVDAARAKGLSGWTVHGIIGVMSVVAKEAVWEYEIPNPVADLKAEHRPKKTTSKTKMHVLSDVEIPLLIAEAFNHGGIVKGGTLCAGNGGAVARDKVIEGRSAGCIVALGVATGFRQSELLGLRWKDCKLFGDTPSVTACGQLRRDGKTWKDQLKSKEHGETRTVEIARALAKLLLEWRAASPYSGEDDYVFTNPETGDPYQQAWAYKVFVAARDRAGVQADLPQEDRCTFHDMRDTYASMLIAGGANIAQVKKALGHEKASTTYDTYVHLWEKQDEAGQIRDIVEKAISF